MLRAVQASSLPAQAETEGGGGNGFLRRRQLRLLTGPSAASRSCAVRRIARAGNRSGAAAAQRAGAFTGGEGGRRPRPAPLRSRPRPGFLWERPAAAARRLGPAARMAVGRRRQLRGGGGASASAGKGGEGPPALLGVTAGSRAGVGARHRDGVVARRRWRGGRGLLWWQPGAVASRRPLRGRPASPPRLLHTHPPPLPSPYPGHPASTFLSGKLGFLFLKYQNT